MKNNRGAISIEMILTIIVILVLGGICIFMLTGDNGIFVPKEEKQIQETNETQNQNAENNENAENAVIVE